ncbi:TPA: hypothetical protein NU465_004396 [Escherichia coli]|uniref:gp53-like domain-containing protein n=1 Tax=Escherichia coli TaxID=562 RepID=UPI000B7F36B3|nr:hypothetical protein [Escherichia coli]EHC2536141.1 hypothetical protein [Escherichia coli]EHZ8349300.1 hypothetical protein [Escherichia coli]MDM1653821.1 hypothetical protein [Escherichia coli]MDM1663061.1 hypothetical protein [Escherichia coli]MDX7974026.1 hypothetical protein [Escherichia coli]
MTSLIKVPFASSGDKTAVPNTDSGGGVNMTQGYGQAYSLDPATDPSAKRIERDKMNWLFNLITTAINEIQNSGITPFITSDDNGGSPYSYSKGAVVSLGGVVYQSLVDTNTTTPPGTNWSAVPEKIQPLDATLTALASLAGAADKLPYFNGDDTAALTSLTSFAREILALTDATSVRTKLGLGSAATRNVGAAASASIPDMSSFRGNTVSNGYLQMPIIGSGGGGQNLVIQWGNTLTPPNSIAAYNVNIAFPNTIIFAIGNRWANGSNASMNVKPFNTQQIQIQNFAPAGSDEICAWIAIGY